MMMPALAAMVVPIVACTSNVSVPQESLTISCAVMVPDVPKNTAGGAAPLKVAGVALGAKVQA